MTHEHCCHSVERDDPGHPTVAPRSGPAARAALMKRLILAGHGEIAGEVGRCSTRPLCGAAISVHLGRDCRRHIQGVNRCQRMLCPICAPFLIRKRLGAIQSLAGELQAQPGLCHYLMTLTVRHGPGTPWANMAQAIRKMRQGLHQLCPWRRMVRGVVRVLESTYGPGGHHLHEHLLVTVEPPDGWDPAAFFEIVHGACQRAAKTASLSCAYAEGWFRAVPARDFVRTLRYFGLAGKWGQADAGQSHGPVWVLPAHAFAEIWRQSKGCRWLVVYKGFCKLAFVPHLAAG